MRPESIKIYTKSTCPYCIRAKNFLEEAGLPFVEVDVSQKPEIRKKLAQENDGYSTVPMVFFDGKFIGGCSELLSMADQLQN